MTDPCKTTPLFTKISRPAPGKKLTGAEFVRRAKTVHGDSYGYTQVDYVNSYTKVRITCPQHGDFYQRPAGHLTGKGCPECANVKRGRRSTAAFVEQAQKVHHGIYSYPDVSYQGGSQPVAIVCPRHGKFEQIAQNHLAGKGCQKCAAVVRGDARRSSLEDFVRGARVVHGDTFDYSQVTYATNQSTVAIICPKHGVFIQTPASHLAGRGCIPCSRARRTTSRADFVARVTEIFSGFYGYSRIETERVRHKDLVEVICPRHGVFSIRANSHLRGKGCRHCRTSQHERYIRRLLDVAGIDYEAQWGHETLRDQLPLRFDFMLPRQKVLIEYDGVFHSAPQAWAGGSAKAEKAFEDTRRRDAVKDRWAANNGWQLIRLNNPKTILKELTVLGVLPDPIPKGRKLTPGQRSEQRAENP